MDLNCLQIFWFFLFGLKKKSKNLEKNEHLELSGFL